MSRLPIPHFINQIKTKLGFDRTLTASGEDVVDAVNKQSQQIDELGPNNTLTSDSTTAALSAAQGKALNDKITFSVASVFKSAIVGGSADGKIFYIRAYFNDNTGNYVQQLWNYGSGLLSLAVSIGGVERNIMTVQATLL